MREIFEMKKAFEEKLKRKEIEKYEREKAHEREKAELRQQSVEHTVRIEREIQECKRLIEQTHELSSMLKDAASPEEKLKELMLYHGAENAGQLLQLNARSFDVCK